MVKALECLPREALLSLYKFLEMRMKMKISFLQPYGYGRLIVNQLYLMNPTGAHRSSGSVLNNSCKSTVRCGAQDYAHKNEDNTLWDAFKTRQTRKR
jgi:hypothetical protein